MKVENRNIQSTNLPSLSQFFLINPRLVPMKSNLDPRIDLVNSLILISFPSREVLGFQRQELG